jgi:hypothetical protein
MLKKVGPQLPSNVKAVAFQNPLLPELEQFWKNDGVKHYYPSTKYFGRTIYYPK